MRAGGSRLLILVLIVVAVVIALAPGHRQPRS